jgi:hypothetical protein
MSNRNKLIKIPAQQNIQGTCISVDDGSKVYDIVNQRKEKLGQFVFSPADVGIVERYEDALKEFDDIQNNLEGTNDASAVSVASDRMKIAIDKLFNADVSGSFFSITSPFTLLESGEFFVVNVLNAVKAVIEKETGTRLNRAKTRASKYTQKYHR